MVIIQPRNNFATGSLMSSQYNPADSTTAYLSFTNNLPPATSTTGRLSEAPITSRRQTINLSSYVTGVLGSSQNATVTIYNLTKGTNQVITTLYPHDTLFNCVQGVTNLYFDEGDQYAIGWTFPAYTTNPTVIYYKAEVTFINY